MQRKLIKIGGEYGVLARFSPKRQYDNACKATVTALDAPYEKFVGTWASRRSEFNDGIEVVFDEDVVQQYDRYWPRSAWPKGYSPGRSETIKAGTKVVLNSPKLVIAEWDAIAESRAAWKIAEDEAARRVDATADVIEPVIAAVREKLSEAGHDFSGYSSDDIGIRTIEHRGTDKHRVTDATVRMDISTLAKLLGVKVAAS